MPLASLLAGFVDAIVGGGGLVMVPALFAAFPGAPPATLASAAAATDAAAPVAGAQVARAPAAAPTVTDALTRYLDAVLLRDQGRMKTLSAAVTRRTAAFSAAGQARR